MADEVLRVGFVGAGKVNFGGAEGPWDHASRIETLSNVKVVGIADPFEEAAKRVLGRRKAGKYADKYSDCALYKNVDDLLENAKPHLVVIGTPPFTRGSLQPGKDMELKCVQAGVHAFVEKPVSLSSREDFKSYVREVEKAQEKTGALLSVGYMFRYHKAILKMKELIQANGGPVMSVSANYHFAYEHSTNAFWWDARESGGPIIEQATHLFDIIRFLAGDVEDPSIVTQCVRDQGPGSAGNIKKVPSHCDVGLPEEFRVPRVTKTQWRFKNGGLGNLTHTVALHDRKYEVDLDIIMDGLRLYLNDPYTDDCTLTVRSNSEKVEVFTFPGDDPYMTEIQCFLDAIKTKKVDSIASTYSDAAKTYDFTCSITEAGKK